MFTIFLSIIRYAKIARFWYLVIIILNIFEAVFAISGITVLFPLIKYLQIGKAGFINYIDTTDNAIINFIFKNIGLPPDLIVLILMAIIPVVLQQLFKFLKEVLILKVQQKATFNIRNNFLTKLFQSHLDFYLDYLSGII